MNEQTDPSSRPGDHPTGGTRTQDAPSPQSGPTSGPRVSGPEMRDLNRLRRSSTDRYLGGVSGGLARHLDIDPTVVRVTFVVLTLFGGAGLLLYIALWLFVPADNAARAPIRIGPESQTWVIVVAGIIATLVFLGSTFNNNGLGFGFPLVLALVAVAVVFLALRDRRDTVQRYAAPPPQGDPMSTPSTYADPSTTSSGMQPPAPPAWAPPGTPAGPPAYVPPPRPRRTGLVLFWPTLALIAIALGTLGIIDASTTVPFSAYPALAVAVTGVMLVVGAFVGRPGGLILIGLLTSFLLVVSSAISAATGGVVDDDRDLRAAPLSAARVADTYSVSTGSIDLDLTRVADVAALGGKRVEVRLNAGEIRVEVPAGVRVNVTGDVRYAGEIVIGTFQRGGLNVSAARTLAAGAGPDSPVLDLDLHIRVGQITVTQN